MRFEFGNPRFIEVNDVRLAVYERPGVDPAILFVHATSFHARCWSQIVARIPGQRAIAVDMRGHGLSSKPEPPYYWSHFGEDVAALARALDLRDACGVGHSMGGHSLVLAASLAPEAFGELLLLDPVILPRQAYRSDAWPPHFASKRRNRWASADEMFERFHGRLQFENWDVEVLRDYCDYGLVPAQDGDGYVLACPPHIEASIYEASGLQDANLYDRFGSIEAPVTVMRSSRRMRENPAADMGASPTAIDLASHFPRARDIETPCSHFIPMEAPAMVAEYVRSRIAANALE